jgi:hypothetical protein
VIEVHTISIYEDPPYRAARYVCDIRFIDRSQGTYMSEMGMPLLNYDKAVSFEGQYLASVIKRAERIITETLCA